MQTLITNNPLAPIYDPARANDPGSRVRPTWITPAEPAQAPAVFAYRLRFTIDAEATARVHVTADERYELWLDGQRVGRGSERGSADAWYYETYDLPLSPGEHILVARVWILGELAPLAQVSSAPGFLLAAEGAFAPLLSTGAAAWEVRRLDGYAFDLPSIRAHAAWFVGANQITDAAAFPWDVETGAGEDWGPVANRIEDVVAAFGIMPQHRLRPATLPPQLSAVRSGGTVRFAGAGDWKDPQVVLVRAGASSGELVHAWQSALNGSAPVVIPAHTRQQVVVDLGQYYCAYPQLVTSGGQGSAITTAWAEALYNDPEVITKGQRDEVEGRYFAGYTRDVVRPDGGMQRRFESLWWRAGCYVQFLVETGAEPLTIESFQLEETRYPLEMESRFTTGDGRLEGVLPILLRGLQMCAHETYMDCPHYEQMMYTGDTRLEVLTTYAITRDDRLPRKALTLFDVSRYSGGLGLVQARYPSHDVQYIAPFSLWWVCMVHDYAAWRSDRAFVRGLLPGVRATIEAFLNMLNEDGVLLAPDGWNFEDWAANWVIGNPPDSATGVSGLVNWHLVYTLGLAARLEEWVGEPELAKRCTREARRLAEKITTLFWDEGRGLFADDLAHEHFSEHTQCMALLSGMPSYQYRIRAARGLLHDPDLTRTTIYFNHYLFETYRILGEAQPLFDRLKLWYDLPAQGFKTTPEMPEPTRSDCHGWGAHPIYHTFATLLGIRPAGFGFERVEIDPLLGPLQAISGSLVHPAGQIDVQLQIQEGRLTGSICLPDGVTGVLRYKGKSRELVGGMQKVEV